MRRNKSKQAEISREKKSEQGHKGEHNKIKGKSLVLVGPADGDVGRAAPSQALFESWRLGMGGLLLMTSLSVGSECAVSSSSYRTARFTLHGSGLRPVASAVVTIRTEAWVP